MIEDTNLKAIHNLTIEVSPEETAVFNDRRYKFESNSQLNALCYTANLRCFQ